MQHLSGEAMARRISSKGIITGGTTSSKKSQTIIIQDLFQFGVGIFTSKIDWSVISNVFYMK